MAKISDLISGRSTLSTPQIEWLEKLIGDWQLLADLSFSDLILWVPLRKDLKSWPTGHVAVAHIRPTTAATLFQQDLIGDELEWGRKPQVDRALSDGEIIKDSEPEQFGEFLIKEETIPVQFNGQIIAVISRHRNAISMRQPGRLELNYREIAHNLYRMVSEGTFPFVDSISGLDPIPRVGDGFIRLDVNGAIVFASPNGRSALSRLGWDGEVESFSISEVAKKLSSQPIADLQNQIQGKSLGRIELENERGTVDFTVLPMLQSGDRIGAIVLLHNVTEIRRRERELVIKDATIKEIHHRVKNNLQTVSALLRLQSRRVEDPTASAALEEAVRRIASIALVHETLTSSSQNQVDFDQVLDSLISHATELAPNSNIAIRKIGNLGLIDPKVATPLSLIVTELIHNALEHGLDSKGSVVEIKLKREGAECEVEVNDDGVGLPVDFDLATSSNLGLQIVRTLIETELKGSLNLRNLSTGTSAQLKFEFI